MTQTTRQRAEELVDAMGNLGVRNRRAKKIALAEALILRERAEAVEEARTALAAAIDWTGDPDCVDGAWHRWRTRDPQDHRAALYDADVLIEKFRTRPTAKQENTDAA